MEETAYQEESKEMTGQYALPWALKFAHYWVLTQFALEISMFFTASQDSLHLNLVCPGVGFKVRASGAHGRDSSRNEPHGEDQFV